MLLRRMMEHVKEQNWTAVALDFVIVVTGVFLGFQLATWADNRSAAARADRSLHQLYEEANAALDFWVREVGSNDGRLELQDRVIAALNAGDRGELTDDEIVRALATIGRYPTISPPRRTYDELTSAGLLREIDAPEAMATVAEYYESVEFIQGQIGFFRPDGDSSEDILDRQLRSVYDPTRLARQRVEADFDQAAADDTYVQTLISVFRNHMIFQFYRRGTMHDAADMCLALAEAVGETCTSYTHYEEWQELPEWQIRDVPPEVLAD